MMATAATAGGREMWRGRTFLRSSSLLLLILGFIFVSFCSAAGDEEAANTAVPPHGYIRQGSGNARAAGDNWSAFGDKYDAGELEPLVRMPGGDSAGSLHIHCRAEPPGRVGLDSVMWTVDDQLDSRAVTVRRRGQEGEEESLLITQETLKRLQVVVVLQDEGIVYCPIPKVASSEWKRAFRWMVGIEEWEGTRANLHKLVSNGLERLTDRGLEETRWAFESDRYLKFVVVRDPAERLVSGFLNKCVKEGYEAGGMAMKGSQNCPYLTIMPELFPGAEKATLATHARFKALMEADPEDTFFHFASGLNREIENHDDYSCKIGNVHYRPQSCFCDLVNLLPAYHVMPFANLSAEAETLAGRLPAASPASGVGVEIEGAGGVMTSSRRTGVTEERREEIHQFLIERFTEYHKVDPKGATDAVDSKAKFLSERVLELIHKMFAQDYELFAEYL